MSKLQPRTIYGIPPNYWAAFLAMAKGGEHGPVPSLGTAFCQLIQFTARKDIREANQIPDPNRSLFSSQTPAEHLKSTRYVLARVDPTGKPIYKRKRIDRKKAVLLST